MTFSGPNGYFFGTNFLGTGMRVIEMDDPDVFTTIMAIGYLSDGSPGSSSIGIAVSGWGLRLSDKGEVNLKCLYWVGDTD